MRKIISFVFGFIYIFFPLFAEPEMDEIQKNSYDLMNYLTVSTMGIKDANNYYSLDNIRKTLQNDINPRLIDDLTKEQIRRLSKSITEEKLQFLERERINYLYENAKSEAIKNALPDPMYLLSGTLMGGGIPGVLATVGMMTINSISNYQSAQNQAEMEYLKSSWSLVGDKIDTIDTRLTNMFSYRVDIANKYAIPNDYYILDEDSVKIYTKILRYDSEHELGDCINQITDFQKYEAIFESYSPYWLDLSEAYFYRANFCSSDDEKLVYQKKCLDSFLRYEQIKSHFFVRDINYANHIPMAIYVAKNVMETNEYYSFVIKELNLLKTNWSIDDKELHYIAAQIYISLASQYSSNDFLHEAYKLVRENIPVLTRNQKSLMDQWVNPLPNLDAIALPEEKKYYDYMVKIHKSSKPPVCKSLIINSELLFELMERLEVSSNEKEEIKNSFNSVSYLFDLTDNNHLKVKKLNEVEFPEQIIISDDFLPSKGKLIFSIIFILFVSAVFYFILYYFQAFCGFALRTIILTILSVIVPLVEYFFTKSVETSLLFMLYFIIVSLTFNHFLLRSMLPGFIAVIFGLLALLIPAIVHNFFNSTFLVLIITMGLSFIVFAILFVIIGKIIDVNIDFFGVDTSQLEDFLNSHK